MATPPPFSLADIREAIPAHCWRKDALRSLKYLARDVIVAAALAITAYRLNQWWAWPMYWFAQGTMFWALFVVGHDCGHQSFSNSRTLNDLIGHITHSAILVPYHSWRISHRKHHSYHGHVERDHSWHPLTEEQYERMDHMGHLGRNTFPISLFAYPVYLFTGSPGRNANHFDPKSPLFNPSERPMVLTSVLAILCMVGILAAATYALGPVAMFNLYFVPYWVFSGWLGAVTYLHHHGPDDASEDAKLPWYRGAEWTFLRGALTTVDRDYGIFNNIHHNIETHVVHHMFPQIPHYHLVEATQAAKKVMGSYYREPVKSPGPLPLHLLAIAARSMADDQVVDADGDVVFYRKARSEVVRAKVA